MHYFAHYFAYGRISISFRYYSVFVKTNMNELNSNVKDYADDS